MGVVNYHAIIVTGCCGEDINEVHTQAKKIFNYVSEISPTVLNGVRSFFIPTNGSKDGWQEADEEDLQCKKFIAWLESKIDDDNSPPISWVEVSYGGDYNTKTCVVNDSNRIIREE